MEATAENQLLMIDLLQALSSSVSNLVIEAIIQDGETEIDLSGLLEGQEWGHAKRVSLHAYIPNMSFTRNVKFMDALNQNAPFYELKSFTMASGDSKFFTLDSCVLANPKIKIDSPIGAGKQLIVTISIQF